MVTIVELEGVVRNVNDRVTRIEQILPTLATRDDMREEGERTRRHFDAVAERLEDHIQLIAEGQGALQEQVDGFKKEMRSDMARLDRRLMRLEASRT
jgi:hypothetical protein